MLGQLLGVFVEVADLERLARAHEPVALGDIAALDAIDGEGHDLAVEDADDAFQRAHPAQGPAAPGHGLRPGEVANDLLDHLGDDLRRRAALAMDVGEPDAVLLHQLLAGQAGGTQEPFHRLVGGPDPGALAVLVPVALGRGQPLGHQGQAARAAEGLHGLRDQALAGQVFARQALEVARGLGLHARGNFFGEQFDQQLGHVYSPARSV